jgi:esterase
VIPAFQSEFHILTFDQRGHGRSFHPTTGYHPRDYAQDLKHILDELGWNSSALVGHSMGGRNALEFAAHFSQRVKVLVLEDIGPDANSAAVAKTEELLGLVPTPFATRAEARDFFENHFPQPQVVGRFLLANIEQKPDGTHDWRFFKPGILESMREGRKEDRWDAFHNLKMPVLVVRGQNSTDLTKPVFQRMMTTLPSALGVEIHNAGHWVHFDQPQAFITELNEFFNTTLGSNL